MTDKDIKIILAIILSIIIPVITVFGLAVNMITTRMDYLIDVEYNKLDSLIDVEYNRCVNAMEKVGDSCSR